MIQDVQELAGRCHGVAVGRGDAFPPVPGGVNCRKIEHGDEPGFAVGAVVGQGLAGPFARCQDAASGVAEVLGAVCLALAMAGDQTAARGCFGEMP